jgi:pimeloyl-ACP methyl ester carboxylesterase
LHYFSSGPLTITDSSITNNLDIGITSRNSTTTITNSEISNNTNYGIFTNGSLTAINNYWGDPTGPTHTSNPTGLGDKVSDGVTFEPWLGVWPPVVEPPTPVRNPVIIVPGVMGTEILNGTDKLWLDLPRNISDIGDEFMDTLQFNEELTPNVADLVLGDVIRKVFIPLFNFDYSNGLINEFQSQGYIEDTDLFLFPYDWRYGVSDDTVLKLKQEITDILAQTGADKIDVVAHSTGGLIVKKYVTQNPIEHKIDKAIFVGVPNTGAPQAIRNFLEGSNFSNPFLDKKEMKKISKNLPVVYDLSPSQQYFDAKGSYIRVIDDYIINKHKKDLSFEEVKSFLIDDHSLNNQALENSTNLHTSEFDNYDLRTNGVNLYSINGCKAGTFGKIIERRVRKAFGIEVFYDDEPDMIPGDGTVPLESATNLPINQENKYFALKTEHSKMPSDNGIRQLIVNIISGSNLETKNISQDITNCKLQGRAIAVYSPVSIDITDEEGNHLGLYSDGVSVENNIPNAYFDIVNERKFIYLPTEEGQTYLITLKGTGEGVFTITDTNIEDNQKTKMQVFKDINVTTLLKGKLFLGEITTLELDTDNDGVYEKTITPDSVLDSVELQDFDPTHRVVVEPEPEIEVEIPEPPVNVNENPIVPNAGAVLINSVPAIAVPTIYQQIENPSPILESNSQIETINNKVLLNNYKETSNKLEATLSISTEESLIKEYQEIPDIELKPEVNNIDLEANAFMGEQHINVLLFVITVFGLLIFLIVVKKFIKR